jgi:hypothetical protein
MAISTLGHFWRARQFGDWGQVIGIIFSRCCVNIRDTVPLGPRIDVTQFTPTTFDANDNAYFF